MKIEKPWGYEIILTADDSPYTGKILHVNAGARGSLQYHDQKQENLTLMKGQATLLLENNGILEEITMEPEVSYLIKPFQKHRFIGITDCDIIEHSTPETGNTFRLEDDYARTTETESERASNR